jgi:hypothetical protein
VLHAVLPCLEEERGRCGDVVPDQPFAVRVRGTRQREIRGAVLHRADLEVVELQRGERVDDAAGVRRRADGNARALERLHARLRRVAAHALDVPERFQVWPRDEHPRAHT